MREEDVLCCAACDYIPSIMCDYAPKTSTNKTHTHTQTQPKNVSAIGILLKPKTGSSAPAAAARRNEFILNRSSRLLPSPPPPPPQHTSGMWLPGMRVCVCTIDCKDFFFFHFQIIPALQKKKKKRITFCN